MSLKKTSSVIGKSFNKAVKNISMKSKGLDLLHNKTLLYVVFAIALVQLFVLSVGKDFFHIVLFLLVGFLTAFFSKNMIVVIVIALVVTNVFKFGVGDFSEGYEGKHDKKGDKKNDKKNKKEKFEVEGIDDELEGLDEEEDEKKEGMEDEEENEKKEGLDEENDLKDLDQKCTKDANCKSDLCEYSEKDGEKVCMPAKKKEGMQNLEYSDFSRVSNLMAQQKTLFSNISKMNPYVVNVDNEAKLRNQLKYESFVNK